MDDDETVNPNPDDKGEEASYALCRALNLHPLHLSDQPGFVGDYHLNWARRQIDVAIAVRASLQQAGL